MNEWTRIGIRAQVQLSLWIVQIDYNSNNGWVWNSGVRVWGGGGGVAPYRGENAIHQFQQFRIIGGDRIKR